MQFKHPDWCRSASLTYSHECAWSTMGAFCITHWLREDKLVTSTPWTWSLGEQGRQWGDACVDGKDTTIGPLEVHIYMEVQYTGIPALNVHRVGVYKGYLVQRFISDREISVHSEDQWASHLWFTALNWRSNPSVYVGLFIKSNTPHCDPSSFLWWCSWQHTECVWGTGKRPQVEVLLENDANPFARIEVGRANLFPPRWKCL